VLYKLRSSLRSSPPLTSSMVPSLGLSTGCIVLSKTSSSLRPNTSSEFASFRSKRVTKNMFTKITKTKETSTITSTALNLWRMLESPFISLTRVGRTARRRAVTKGPSFRQSKVRMLNLLSISFLCLALFSSSLAPISRSSCSVNVLFTAEFLQRARNRAGRGAKRRGGEG